MPPLIVAVLIGAGAYAGYRAAQHVWNELTVDRPEADATKVRTGEPNATLGEKDLGALEYDPATGVWRPAARR